MKQVIFIIIALIFVTIAKAQQPSVVINGLRYEKIAEGKAKLVAVDNYETYCQAVINNNAKLIIPDFVTANESELLKVTEIGSNSLDFVLNVTELNYFLPVNLTLPSYLEEIKYSSLTKLLQIDTLIVRSFYPPITNVGALFGVNFSDPFPFGPEFSLGKIIIPKGSIDYYNNAPGWKDRKYLKFGIEESDTIPKSISPLFIEQNGYVGKFNDSESNIVTLLYKIPEDNEVILDIPSIISSKNVNYTVIALGSDMFGDTQFEQINIPSTVRRLENGVFLNSSITEITGMEGLEYAESCAFGAPKLRKLTLPESMTRMTDSMFRFGKLSGCLDELTLPSTLTEIEDVCFHNVELKKVISKNPVAPVAGYDFFAPLNHESCGDLIVPEGSEESYLAQPGWRRFARINGVKYADYVTPLYDQAIVRANGRAISIATASEVNYEIYSSAGVKVAAGKASNDLDIALDTPGVYVVKIAQTSSSAAPLTTKIAIR